MKDKLFLFFFLSLFFLLASGLIFAQQRLSIIAFPAVQDKQVQPGEKTHLQIQFKNDDTSFITGQVKVADYVVSDKDGTTILVEGNQPRSKYAASSWITLGENNITIPPNDVVTVDIYVSVPQDVPHCGSYAVVYFQPALPGKNELQSNLNSATGITAKIGGLINFKVNGRECRENIVISKFQAPFLQEFGPVKVNLELLSNSDIDLQPIGVVNLTNLFGRYADSQRLKDQRIFPETVKAYQLTLGHRWMIGRYKLTLNATYGSSGKKLIVSTYIWIIPWRLILIIILTIIIIMLLIKSISGKSRREKLLLESELKAEKEQIQTLKDQLRKKKL